MWRLLLLWLQALVSAYSKSGITGIIHIACLNPHLSSLLSAVPGFIKPVLLQVKGPDGIVRNQEENKDQTYRDGSIEQVSYTTSLNNFWIWKWNSDKIPLFKDIPTAIGLAETLNCQFFITAQCNPHIVPFLYSSKGGVGQPSRWTRGFRKESWRGGFLLAALELYLKSDMRAKFHFLK